MPLSLLLVGLGARIAASRADLLNLDVYALMEGVSGSFHTYVFHNGTLPPSLPLALHYWLTYRVLGGGFSSYVILPLISSLAVLLVVYWGLRHYWPANRTLCFFTLLVLIYNGYSLYLVQYALWAYANQFLVSSCLFFLFLRLSEGKLTPKQWAWFMVLMAPLAFFTALYTMVPLITGIFSVIAVRYLRLPGYRTIGALLRSLLEMWPLILFPLLYLAFEIITPTFASGLSNLYLDPYIFGRAEYSHTIIGGVQFLVHNSYGLLIDLLRSATRDIFPVRVTAIAAISSIILIIAVGLWRHRLDTKISFVLIFTAVTLVALMAGSLLGLIPYGNARHAYFLILPLSVIIGYGASLVLSAIWTRLEFLKRPKLVPVALAILILAIGTTTNVNYWHTNTTITDQNRAALQAFHTAKVDLVLYTPYPMIAITRAYPSSSETRHLWGGVPVLVAEEHRTQFLPT